MHKLLTHPAAPGVLFQQNHVGTYRSLKLAFSSAEHHFRESVRRSRMVRYGGMAFGAAVALLMVDVLFHITGAPVLALALFPIVWVGVAAFVRFIASTPGNLHNPYRPRPWRRRNRW